tara:strand:- start:4236 stop:4604 length:369 start_codon:yes stop_codon:yes gene_type:complete
MQLTKDFASKLATAATPTRAYPAIAKTTNLPAVVYSGRGGIREAFYSGSYGMRETRFQVDVYAKTYTEVATLKDSIITAFHGFTGAMGSSTVSRCTVDNTLESFSDSGEKIFRIIIEITILD